MVSKMVTDRQKSGQAIIASAESHKNEIVEAIGRRLQPLLAQEEELPDLGLLLLLLGRLVEERVARMVAADEAHARELDDDDPWRVERNTGADDLRTTFLDAKEILTTVYGAQTTSQAGLSGPIPTDPVALARLGTTVAIQLAALELPPPRVPGAQFDAAGLATRIREQTTRLQTAIRQVATEVRELETTQTVKDQAIAAYDETFGQVANLLTALYRFGNAEELARRVRPSLRRPGRTVVDAEAEREGTGATPTVEPTE